jgi:hypothetical protein
MIPTETKYRTTTSFKDDERLVKEFNRTTVSCYNISINIADYGIDKIKDYFDEYNSEDNRNKRLLEIRNMTVDELDF